MACERQEKGKKCPCTYGGCPRHGKCCECLEYHLKYHQLPACCFPPEVERTYDRSFDAFINCRKK
ncbi:MAG: cytosolic protein [Abditibacteriota bacterium]|nr:cytosolic protein [Abditibacteriota bacterium]